MAADIREGELKHSAHMITFVGINSCLCLAFICHHRWICWGGRDVLIGAHCSDPFGTDVPVPASTLVPRFLHSAKWGMHGTVRRCLVLGQVDVWSHGGPTLYPDYFRGCVNGAFAGIPVWKWDCGDVDQAGHGVDIQVIVTPGAAPLGVTIRYRQLLGGGANAAPGLWTMLLPAQMTHNW
jgi:hypothetical protein